MTGSHDPGACFPDNRKLHFQVIANDAWRESRRMKPKIDRLLSDVKNEERLEQIPHHESFDKGRFPTLVLIDEELGQTVRFTGRGMVDDFRQEANRRLLL